MTTSIAAQAAPGDAFTYTLRESAVFDDNLFRLAEGVPAASGHRADAWSVTDVAAAFDRSYGIQRVRLGLGWSATRYRRNTQLDGDTASASAGWFWRSGNQLDGEVSWSRNEAQSPFSDLAGQLSNTATTNSTALAGNYAFHPAWSVGTRLNESRRDNSLSRLAASASTTRSVDTNLRYQPASGNTVTFRRVEIFADSPDPLPPGSPGNDYRESDTGLELRYGSGEVSGFGLGVSHVSKRYRDDPTRDFQGWAGTASWAWRPTGRLSLNATAQRSASAPDDPQGRSTVTDTIAANVSWTPGARWSVRATVAHADRTLLGVAPDASDRTVNAGVATTYSPLQSLNLSLDVGEERRSGNSPGSDFRSRMATLTVAWSF